MFRNICLLVVASAFALGAIAGCGGSDSGESTDSAPLSKAAFIEKGDAICERLQDQQIEALEGYEDAHPEVQKELSRDPSATQGKVVKIVAVAPIEASVSEFRALAAPEGDEQEVEAILEALEEAAETLEQDPSSFFVVNKKGWFTSLHERAAAYGFKVCSTAP